MSTVQIQPGWHHGMSMTDYLAIEAMSASGIELIRRSPAHFRFAQQNPPKPTPAMIEGSALHTALLEPHLFEGRYIALGQCDGIKKDGQRCGYQASVYRGFSSYCGTHDPSKGEPMADGIEVITEDALERIGGIRHSILAHPEASRFFAGQGQSELVGVWLDEQSGVLCKIRLDRDIGRAAIHCDIKTTGTSAETDAFARQVGRLGYARKCAFYRRGMAALGKPAIGSVLIAVEAQKPHCCQAFLLDEGDIAGFQPEIDRLLGVYRECLDTGVWSGYPTGLRHLKLMPWDEPKHVDEWDDAASEAA
jgi:hypothetical protein